LAISTPPLTRVAGTDRVQGAFAASFWRIVHAMSSAPAVELFRAPHLGLSSRPTRTSVPRICSAPGSTRSRPPGSTAFAPALPIASTPPVAAMSRTSAKLPRRHRCRSTPTSERAAHDPAGVAANVTRAVRPALPELGRGRDRRSRRSLYERDL
jgi:hypothetical protein